MIIDILFVVFLGGGFWWGYRKGIIYSVFSLLAYFIGIIVALKFSYLLIKFLHGTLNLSPKAMAIVAFILMLLLVVVLIKLIAWGLEQVLKSFSLNLVNQVIGGLIFSLIGLYLMCVMIWFLNVWGIFPDHQKRASHTYPYIANLAPTVVEYSGKVVPMFKTAFHDIDALIRNA